MQFLNKKLMDLCGNNDKYEFIIIKISSFSFQNL